MLEPQPMGLTRRMKEPAEIMYLAHARRMRNGLLWEKMSEIQAYYNNENIVLPLPDIDEITKPVVANTMISGIDQTAGRIASVMPDVMFPAQKPDVKKYADAARTTRRAVLGWWEMNAMRVSMSRRARHLIAYSSTPVLIVPDFKRGIPKWEQRNPLASMPAEKLNPDDVVVDDCIFIVMHTYRYLRSRYPSAMSTVSKPKECTDEEMFECLEYVDDNERSLFVLGKSLGRETGRGYSEAYLSGRQRVVGGTTPGITQGSNIVALSRVAARIELCPAVVPSRTVLDRPKGQFDDMPGIYEARAMLEALNLEAVRRGVFPRTYVTSDALGRPGRVVTAADPRRGVVGKVEGDIKDMPLNPGFLTSGMADRLERAEKQAGKIPSEFQGESPTNVRTDRRGGSVLSAVIDQPIAEAQEVLALSLREENIRALEISKRYFGNTPKSYYVNWRGASGPVAYTPNKDFVSNEHFVSYAIPGADQGGQTIIIGQMVGTGLMSRETGRQKSPLIEDAESEKDKIATEAIDDALLASLQTIASQPITPESPLSLLDIAKIRRWIASDKMDIAEALLKIDEEKRKAQAAITSEGEPDLALPGSPETMPGLDPAAAAAAGGAPALPDQSVQGMTSLLGALRLGQMTTPQEEAPISA